MSHRFPADFGLSEGKCKNHIRPRLPMGVQFASVPRSFALLTEYLLVSVPAGTKIFQFPACALAPCGARNSGITGSRAACAYPVLIAACHALHRILSLAVHCVAVTHYIHFSFQRTHSSLHTPFRRARHPRRGAPPITETLRPAPS